MVCKECPHNSSFGKEINTLRKRGRGGVREGGRMLYFELISSFLPVMAREASSHVSVALCKQRCHGNTSCLSWHDSRPLNNISSTHKRTLCPLIKFTIMLMFTIQPLLLALCSSRRPGDIFQEMWELEADWFQKVFFFFFSQSFENQICNLIQTQFLSAPTQTGRRGRFPPCELLKKITRGFTANAERHFCLCASIHSAKSSSSSPLIIHQRWDRVYTQHINKGQRMDCISVKWSTAYIQAALQQLHWN